MKPALRRWRRLRRWLLTAIACVVVGAAGLMAVARLMLPWLVDSPDSVAAWLSERIGRNVELESVSATWDGAGPLLDLSGLTISGAAGDPAAISLGRARVKIDIYAMLWPGRHLIREFLLVDARVELAREKDGRIVLEGFGPHAADLAGLSAWLSRVGHIGLTGGQLDLVDRQSGRSFSLDAVELRMSQHGSLLSVGLERHSRDGEGRLRVVLEQHGALHWPPAAAQLYVEAQHFPIADLSALTEPFAVGLRTGVLDGRQWLSWENQQLASLRGDWSIESLVMSAPGFEWADGGIIEPNMHLPLGRLVLAGARDDLGFALDLRAGAGTTAEQMGTELSARIDNAGAWQWVGSELSVALLANAAVLLQSAPHAVRSRMYAAQPRGLINQMQARMVGDSWQVHADLADLQFAAAAARWPAVSGLAVSLSADNDALIVTARGQSMEFAVDGVFREPVVLSSFDLLLGARREAGDWVIEAPKLAASGAGFAVDMSWRAQLDQILGPQLQLAAHVPGANIEAAKAFWMINKMPPRTVQWLDNALGAGQVTDAWVQYRGALADWPFAAKQGRLEARFVVAGADLDYHADWPRAEKIDAEGVFINSSLVFDRATGSLLGNRVVRGKGSIASLKDPILTLDLAGQGDAAGWLQFLKASPLQRKHGSVLFGMSLNGPVDIDAELILPLRKNLGQSTLAGKALLQGVVFSDTKWDLRFDDVHGRADFSESGFAADRLSLLSSQMPAELSLAVGSFSADPALQVEAALTGKLTAQSLFGHYEALTTILSQLSGSADWRVNLAVTRNPSELGKTTTRIRYHSDLQGTAIGFPSPFGKVAANRLPLTLVVDLPPDDTSAPQIRLDIGEQARLFAVIGTAASDFRGQLQLGAATAQDLPARGLRVTGHSTKVDVPGWAGWVFAGTSLAGPDAILTDIDLSLGDDNRLKLDRSEGPWLLQLSGPTAQGSIRFDTIADQSASVTAQFEHLYLPEPAGDSSDLLITPAMVPTLHFWVKDLRIGEAQLGEARLEAFAKDGGLRVELLEARSPELAIHASGDWLSKASGPESRFKIRMVAEDLGRMMTRLGFAGVIAGGQTLAEIDARWRGPPHAFALERLTGSIDISVGQGRFLDVNPGAGRIFGLLSLRELPRRLSLDFRDLFQSGMSFDRIEGRFLLGDGNAWTENLTVRGPAADILIIGRTGLLSRDYDQQVMVSPHLSGVLPVIGGLAAGPVGAAAGFLAQGMVQKDADIEKSSRAHYSVAGSWEKPVVARLTPARPDAEPRRNSATTDADAG